MGDLGADGRERASVLGVPGSGRAVEEEETGDRV